MISVGDCDARVNETDSEPSAPRSCRCGVPCGCLKLFDERRRGRRLARSGMGCALKQEKLKATPRLNPNARCAAKDR